MLLRDVASVFSFGLLTVAPEVLSDLASVRHDNTPSLGGGTAWIRARDLLGFNQALYQLSYGTSLRFGATVAPDFEGEVEFR